MNKNVTISFLCFSGFNLFKTFFENVNLCDHRLKRQGTQLVSPHSRVSQHLFDDVLFFVSLRSDIYIKRIMLPDFSAWNALTWQGWILSGASPWKPLMKR